MNSLLDEAQDRIEHLLDAGEETKRLYRSHTFFVACCKPGHDFFDVYESARKVWRAFWGTTRHDVQKGFVQMIVGNENEAPDVDTSRE